jgi:hypothetical protein
MGGNRNRIVPLSTDPDRFTEEERALFAAGQCGWLVSYGMPWSTHCGKPSKPGASFGHCAEHEAELLEDFWPDGSRR